MIRRLIEFIRFPPPYEGPILSGRIDGVAYVFGWVVTVAHLALAGGVLLLGFGAPWPTVSAVASSIGALFFITIVIVIHRRIGEQSKLPRDVVWQWWLGPWDRVRSTGLASSQAPRGVPGDRRAAFAGGVGVIDRDAVACGER